jgi:hypothetical protein
VLDAGEATALGNLDWTSVEPAGTTLRFQVRSSNDPDSLGEWSEDITVPGCLPDVPGRYLQYRALLGTTDPGTSPVLKDITFTYVPAGIRPADGIPPSCGLTARPNPCSRMVTICFTLGAGERVGLGVFDVAGRRVRGLADGWLPAGNHQITWDGLDAGGAPLSSGLYWLRIDTPDLRETRELVLIR